MADVHPETFQIEGVQFAIFDDGGESFLFDRCGAELDAAEDRRVEDVETGVDPVADVFDGLFHEAIDAGGVVGFVDYDAVFGGFFHFGDDDGAFFAVGFVEVGELLEGVFADDVGVEDEEGGVVFAEGLFGEFEGAGCAEGFGLDGEFDLDVVLFFVLWIVSDLTIQLED